MPCSLRTGLSRCISLQVAKLNIKNTFPFEVNGKVVKGKWKGSER